MSARAALVEKIEQTRLAKGLTWKAIAAEIGGASPMLVTAALLGQMTLTAPEAAKAAALLELSGAEEKLLTQPPLRGSLPIIAPSDPLIYRFYELMQVYGTTWKALIEEEFGDGIMSAIDFEMEMERQPDPKGDRVRLTFSGKFLPYRRY
jgi:cyanate lyase